MNDLRRELAPIQASVWDTIEADARRTLKVALAGRRLVDFEGPLGWSTSSIPLGRVTALGELDGGVRASLRRTQPLVELMVPFELQRSELDAMARGAEDAELAPMQEAARAVARAEDGAIFNGYAPGAISGICESAQGSVLSLSSNYQEYAAVVADALSELRRAGVAGPYAIALGPRCYAGLTKTTLGGYPVLKHVTELLDGPVVWAPAVEGAVVLSLRGGDFELTVGRDLSIGYSHHTAESVALYFQESFTFRVLGPEAAVVLKYG